MADTARPGTAARRGRALLAGTALTVTAAWRGPARLGILLATRLRTAGLAATLLTIVLLAAALLTAALLRATALLWRAENAVPVDRLGAATLLAALTVLLRATRLLTILLLAALLLARAGGSAGRRGLLVALVWPEGVAPVVEMGWRQYVTGWIGRHAVTGLHRPRPVGLVGNVLVVDEHVVPLADPVVRRKLWVVPRPALARHIGLADRKAGAVRRGRRLPADTIR